MNENNIVLENTSLFLDLDQAVPQLAERISHLQYSSVLMVVLCQDAMPVAKQIAATLGFNLIFSAIDLNRKTPESLDIGIPLNFDYGIVKESGRDIPQNYIVHQEQKLRMNLVSIYSQAYETFTKTYPDKLIVLVDQLTNIDAAFFQCLTQKDKQQSAGRSFSVPSIRQFIFLHVANGKSEDSVTHGIDMIIEHYFAEDK
jgi:hypothetical protein